MINLEMDRYNLKIKIKCIEPEATTVNTKEFLTALDKFISQLDFYETVEISMIKDSEGYEI